MNRARAQLAGCVAALTLLSAGIAMPGIAQTRPVLGTVDAVVTDSSLVPLSDAIASVVGSNVQVVTGANGRFRILDLPVGRHILLVRRLGYEPVSAMLQVDAGDTLRLSFPLERVANSLDKVVVTATRPGGRLAEFEERRAAGIGVFMNEPEIAQRNSVTIEDLLRGITTTRFRAGSTPLKGCIHEQWYLDGVALSMSTKRVDLPSPKDLAGIEYYSGPARIPVQFKSTGGAGFCGVLLFWTKGG